MPNATDRNLGLTRERLQSLLSYDPVTGEFRWIAPEGKKSTILVGTVAGHLHAKTGYRRICIGKRLYRAHRLAWLYMTGEWPAQDVDHRNGARSDDRWANLRAASNAENTASQRLRLNNTSGFKGVHYDKSRGKWVARVMHNYRCVFARRFLSFEDACSAYVEASRAAFGEFARISEGA